MLRSCNAFNNRFATIKRTLGTPTLSCVCSFNDGNKAFTTIGDEGYSIRYGAINEQGQARHSTDLMRVIKRVNTSGIAELKLTMCVGKYEVEAIHTGEPANPDVLLKLFDEAIRELDERSREQDLNYDSN